MKRRLLTLVATIIIIMTVGCAPQEAARKADRPQRQTIIINDHTGPEWEGVIAETVEDFRAIMPPRGPRLKYVRGEYQPCAQGIRICSGPAASDQSQHWWGLARWGGGLKEDQVWLREGAGAPPDDLSRQNVACHEMMHVLLHIGDNYDSDPNSCLFGRLPDPGSTDIALIRERYGGKR